MYSSFCCFTTASFPGQIQRQKILRARRPFLAVIRMEALFTITSGCPSPRRVAQGEETEASRRVRWRLHQHDPAPKERGALPRMTQAERRRRAQEALLGFLMDPTVFPRTQRDALAETLAEWASREPTLKIDPEVAKETFKSAEIQTESIPPRNTFRIRVKM
jgi:hypothetical protein